MSIRATVSISKFLRDNLQLALDGLRFKQHLMPVRQLASLAVEFPLLGSGAGAHPFRTVTDYENFLKRIDAFETWVDTAIANMRQGIAVGVIQPRPVIERALPQLAGDDRHRCQNKFVLSAGCSYARRLQ